MIKMMTRKEECYTEACKYIETNHSNADNDFQNAMNTAVLKAYMAGAQWADKTMIEKARNWIEDNITTYFDRSDYMGREFIEAMEEQL